MYPFCTTILFSSSLPTYNKTKEKLERRVQGLIMGLKVMKFFFSIQIKEYYHYVTMSEFDLPVF